MVSEVKLATGETMVKTYHYAQKKKGWFGKKYDCILHVTNKRIINVENGRQGIRRSEAYLESICGVDASYGEEKKRWFSIIMSFIIGIPTSLVLIGIPLVIHAVRLLKIGKKFDLTFLGTTSGESIAIGVVQTAKTRKKRAKKLKITVDASASNMVDELGTMIMQLQSQNATSLKA